MRCFKRMIAALLGVVLLAGCWDYQGLGEQTIVAGIAVDWAEDGEGFRLTFEVVDLLGGEGGQFGSILLTTTGETLAEAVYDAHTRLRSPIYLGVAEVVIVGRGFAEEVGIEGIVNYLMRDRYAQNSLRIVVSSTETAAELFGPAAAGDDDGEEQGAAKQQRMLLSQALSESLDPRRGATDAPMAFEIYHSLNRGTSDLALPVVSSSEVEDIPFELEGLAIFEGDRMVRTLPEEDMAVYLLVTSGVRDRVFSVEMGDERAVVAVRDSRARTDFSLEDGVLRFFLDIHVRADVVQVPDGWGEVDQLALRELEAEVGRVIAEQVVSLVWRLGDEGHDIFGFADVVRSRDVRLWENIAADWQMWFRSSEVEPQVSVRIAHTGMMR